MLIDLQGKMAEVSLHMNEASCIDPPSRCQWQRLVKGTPETLGSHLNARDRLDKRLNLDMLIGFDEADIEVNEKLLPLGKFKPNNR
ncbi:hypothetical protein N8542_04090 [Verrucomicrobia bacterium]|nr:hypothetical protein [Verrucomicrobiota bacterium]